MERKKIEKLQLSPILTTVTCYATPSATVKTNPSGFEEDSLAINFHISKWPNFPQISVFSSKFIFLAHSSSSEKIILARLNPIKWKVYKIELEIGRWHENTIIENKYQRVRNLCDGKWFLPLFSSQGRWGGEFRSAFSLGKSFGKHQTQERERNLKAASSSSQWAFIFIFIFTLRIENVRARGKGKSWIYYCCKLSWMHGRHWGDMEHLITVESIQSVNRFWLESRWKMKED